MIWEVLQEVGLGGSRAICRSDIPHENHMKGQSCSFFSDFLGNDECQPPRK